MKKVYIKRNSLFKGMDMILCNNIIQADENFIEDNYSLFFVDCEECKGKGEVKEKTCEECGGEGQNETNPYQYFIINPDSYQLERLKEYGVEVGYSNLLDVHVLPIYDFGTSWSLFSYSKEVDNDYQLANDETLKRETCY